MTRARLATHWHDGRIPLLALLAGLYIAQGIGHGFFSRTLPTLLRQQSASLEVIGYASLVFLPWSLNFLWAPLVDRWHSPHLGPRRSWIVPIQFGLAAIFVTLGFTLTDLPVAWLCAAAVLASLVAATGDIATDAYAVDRLGPGQRGLGNSLQIAGYWIGMMLGGGMVLVIAAQWGIAAGTGCMAVLFLLVAVGALLTPEPAAVPRPAGAPMPSLRAFLRRRDAWTMILVVLCMRFGDSFTKGMVQPFLVDAGVSGAEIGMVYGTVGVAAAVTGSIVAGLLLRRMPRRPALLLFGLLQALSVSGYGLLAAGGPAALPFLPLVIGVAFFFTSCAFVALFTAMMDCCDPRQAGTDFTIQACAANLVEILAGTLSGHGAATLGYVGHFGTGLVLALLGVAVIAFVTRRGLPAPTSP